MNVLVTGGSGFIGSHIVEYHLNRNDVVHVIDDLSTGKKENIGSLQEHPNFHFIQADLLTYPDIYNDVAWADRIYHMAAVVGVLKVINDSERLLATNITGTERLLRAARVSKRKPRILLASTSEVYGPGRSNKPLNEKSKLVMGAGRKSCAVYAVSKLAIEYFGLSYFDHYELAVTVMRIFNTIGPRQQGQYGMVVPRFIRWALDNEPISIYGTGEQSRSFGDVRDMVAIMDKIASNPEAIGQIVNVAHDQEISINNLAKLIKKLAHSDSKIIHKSYDEAYGEGFEDYMYRRPSVTKLRKLTKHRYQWDLKKTLLDLIEKERAK